MSKNPKAARKAKKTLEKGAMRRTRGGWSWGESQGGTTRTYKYSGSESSTYNY